MLNIPSARVARIFEEIGIPTLREVADLSAKWLSAIEEMIGPDARY